MKKHCIVGVVLLLFVVIFAVSCAKEEPEVTEETAPVVVVSEPERILHHGLILEDSVSKYTLNGEGTTASMERKESSTLGEAVQVFMVPDTANPEKLIPEMRTAPRGDLVHAGNKTPNRDFNHVITDDGQDLWIQDYYVATDIIPGIVLNENAFVFRGPSVAEIFTDSRKIPQYHFVGVHQAESTSDFLCISAYVYEWYPVISTLVRKQFVRRDAVTTNTLDIEVLELLKVAKSLKDESAKRAVLDEAMSKGGNFNYLVAEAVSELNGPSAFTVTSYLAEGDFVTADEENGNINIRNNPGTIGTEVLFSVPVNTAIVVTGLTNETEKIDDYEDYWYQISVPSMGNRTGWIFGKYIYNLK